MDSVFDPLDMRLLHALELDGRAPFSRIAAVLGVSDQTVARRYRRLRERGGVRVVGTRDHQRLGSDQWMLRLRCAPEAADTIAQALARRPDTLWIAITSGGTEIALHLRPRSSDVHDDLVLGKLPRTPRIIEIRAHQMLHRFFGGPDGWVGKLGALGPEETAALRRTATAPAGPVRLDPADGALVRALERDGRASLPELQRATGRSESAVKRRLAALLDSGAVFLDIDYDTSLMGFGSWTLLSVTVRPDALDEVGAALARHPEIAFASATTGTVNLIAVAIARDAAHLYRYLSRGLGALDGVRHVETSPFVRRVKQLTYPAPF